MNKAYSNTINDFVNIEDLKKGSPELLAIASHDLKCSDDECNASVILCSFLSNNIPPAYFRAISIEHHRANCSGLSSSSGVHFNDDELVGRNVGRAAFNKIFRTLIEKEDKPIATWNRTTRTRSITNFGEFNKTSKKSRVKVGPIVYDPEFEIKPEVSYIASLKDLIPNATENGVWINLKGVEGKNLTGIGLQFENNSKISELLLSEDLQITFICKFISKRKTTGMYSTHFDYILSGPSGPICSRVWTSYSNVEKSYIEV